MPDPTGEFAATEAHVRPMWFGDGTPITIEVQGYESLRDTTVTAVVSQMSAVDVSRVLQVPVCLDEHGSGTYTHSEGLSLGHEATVYVGSLIEDDGPNDPREHVFPDVWFSIANPSEPLYSVEDVVRVHERIAREHEATYLTQIGDPSAPGAIEHRVLCVVASLYLTTEMKLPGMRILPIVERGAATDEREIINGVLEEMAWPTRLGEKDWQRSAQAQMPLALVVCQSVWAPNCEAAGELATRPRGSRRWSEHRRMWLLGRVYSPRQTLAISELTMMTASRTATGDNGCFAHWTYVTARGSSFDTLRQPPCVGSAAPIGAAGRSPCEDHQDCPA